MAGLRPLIRLWQLTYYRWAAKEIDPMHPDAGHIALRIAELESSNA